MQADIDRGLPFEVADFWREPTWTADNTVTDSLFSPIDTEALPLLKRTHDASKDGSAHFAFDIPNLSSPSLDLSSPLLEDLQPKQEVEQPTKLEDGAVPFDFLVFGVEDLEPITKPNLLTWEAFRNPHSKHGIAGSNRTLYLSEAGPLAFDAAFNTSTKPGACIGTLPRDAALRALCSLVLGRSSSLYRWDEGKQAFVPTLHNAPISGTSLTCSASAISEFTETGTTLVRLREFSNIAILAPSRQRQTSACPARVALQSCVGRMLDGVEDIISRGFGNVRTILQLQVAITRPRQLLDMIASLVDAVKDCTVDEGLVSAIADFVHLRAQGTDEFCSILRIVLAQVSAPWLEQLAADIGFRDPLHGLTTNEAHVQGDLAVQESASSFLAPADADLVRETKSALAVIQESSPEHSLLTYTPSAGRTPFEVLLDSTLRDTKVAHYAREYERSVTALINGATQPGAISSKRDDRVDPSSSDSPGAIWDDDVSKESYVDGLNSLMSQQLMIKDRGSSPELREAVVEALEINGAAHGTQFMLRPQEETVVSPIERVRPLLRTQHQLVNGIVLRLLLREHRLEEHLTLYRSFHLFGSGHFADHVSTALFSPELQSAERKRGVVPTSQQMGLRLGAADHKNWPPASSELCLILMGVLSRVIETRQSQQRGLDDPHGQHHHLAQAGGITFAVRELSEEEIDRTMDMNSIHALDFLGLQYNMPAPVRRIITPEVTAHYDTVFRFLLLQQRILYLTAHCTRTFSKPSSSTRAAYLQLAHHITTTTLSHFMDLGIAAPWRDLKTSLSIVMHNLEVEEIHGEIGTRATLGIDGLKRVHTVFIDRVRGRLFLKKKQAPLRGALEELFALVLKGCLAFQQMDDGGDFALEKKILDEALGRFCGMLEDAVRKVPKSGGAMEVEGREAQRVLLGRLKWNANA